MSGRSFRRAIAVLLLVGITTTATFFGGPILEWIRSEELWQRTELSNAPATIMRSTVSRRSGKPIDGSVVEGWSAKTGRRVLLWENVVDGQYRFFTYWDPAGEIVRQARSNGTGGTKFRHAPPWWNGKVDETDPSAPWIEAGLTADAWWERVRER